MLNNHNQLKTTDQENIEINCINSIIYSITSLEIDTIYNKFQSATHFLRHLK